MTQTQLTDVYLGHADLLLMLLLLLLMLIWQGDSSAMHSGLFEHKQRTVTA